MKVTLVKKVLANGSPCKKCIDVLEKLEAADQMQFIDDIVIADESDKNSPGMLLAAKYDVSRAPFFVVEKDDQQVDIHTIYFKFVKEVIEVQQL